MKKIPLSQNKFAIVDNEDFESLSKYKWFYNKIGYAVRNQGAIRMHRVIMNAKKGQIIDHINTNKLDNRKINLRPANKSTNGINRGAQVNSKSKIKGVCFSERDGVWRAYLTVNGRQVFHSNYKKLSDAIEARRLAALKYHGEYAYEKP